MTSPALMLLLPALLFPVDASSGVTTERCPDNYVHDSVLLSALLFPYDESSEVTIERCPDNSVHNSVRRYPVDDDAIYLALQYCGLTDADILIEDFVGLPNLEEIFLYSNDLEHINQVMLQSVPTLTKLYLVVNKIYELPVFEASSCANLTVLNLAQNLLTEIDANTFSACVKLRELTLSYNKIENINPDLFASLTELRMLNLGGNRIRSIPELMLSKNAKLEHLKIDYNLLSILPDRFVTNLKHTSVCLVHFYFYNNPWDCVYLLKMLAEVKKVGVPYYKGYPFVPAAILHNTTIMHYTGTRPECVYSQKSLAYSLN